MKSVLKKLGNVVESYFTRDGSLFYYFLLAFNSEIDFHLFFSLPFILILSLMNSCKYFLSLVATFPGYWRSKTNISKNKDIYDKDNF